MSTNEDTGLEAQDGKGKSLHPSCVSGSTFIIFRHHSRFSRSLFPCILTISTLFNNRKYFIFTDEWDIFPFSGACILSTWIHDTHTLIVLSYKSP